MHNGAFQTLGEVVNHYNTKQASTNAFTGANMLQAADLAPTLLPTAGVLQNLSPLFLQVPSDLTPQEIGDILAFLQSLTDPAAINRRQEVPATVPSGLPVDQ
jgi:cytochrome c peroxidase